MSDTLSSPISPARLYSLQLRLRPLEAGTLMPFSGELVHAAWLDWMRSAAPEVSASLHEGNKRRLFTCSSLQFPYSRERMLQAERDNIHLPVQPDKTYTIRITLLLSELFPLLYNRLLHFNFTEAGAKKSPFMRIGKREFLLEEVVSVPNNANDWVGFTSFSDLVKNAANRRMGHQSALTLEFASLTTFSWINVADKTYGSHYARLPLPKYIFPGLARRWQEIAPSELAHLVQKECIERYVEADGIVIDTFELKSHEVQFVKHPQRGFTGSCTYQLRGPDEPGNGAAELTVRQQIFLLASLAFYTGIGYKTPMGMGQVRPLFT